VKEKRKSKAASHNPKKEEGEGSESPVRFPAQGLPNYTNKKGKKKEKKEQALKSAAQRGTGRKKKKENKSIG